MLCQPQLMMHLPAAFLEFCYNPKSWSTYTTWFKSWEDTFRIQLCKQYDAWNARLLTCKLESNEHTYEVDYILPKLPRGFSFEERVTQLLKVFDEPSLLFSIRDQCLNLVKREADDYGAQEDFSNECEQFELNSLMADQFKCLLFIKALKMSRLGLVSWLD